MRQVFSSPRLENVERVAQLLRDDDIEVRVTQGRSYKGNRRGAFSYSEKGGPQPAVWVAKSEDQVRARELLRAAGLIDSTRGAGPGNAPFRFEPKTQAGPDASRRRATRIKLALVGGIVIVGGMAVFDALRSPPAPQFASPPFGTQQATPPSAARAAFAHAYDEANLPVLCLSVDGRDAPAALIDTVARKPFTSVPASHCRRVADSETGSVLPNTRQPALIVEVRRFTPSAPDAATVELEAYHHQLYGSYKTLQLRYVDGAWRVTDTLRHVSMQG
ncbi:hypothetical protein [Cognatilysobacter bugurensis]|uniref:DUF2007 domain-containing protein n=1 Tax=Cognatilysobacter bugurensis TaxID=543356 RepID=A0A918SU58_9GAMM|nr:hypothetical protein [Lysobacter bugurensis]GHA69367.1 hypothetical protein GCM10007067_01630 [Lysobacter bugurensis]